MFLLYAQWEHFDHMAHFEENLKFVQDVAQFLTCNHNVPQNEPCDQNVPQNEPCDQNVPTGYIVRTF